jgi:hypothetical protein
MLRNWHHRVIATLLVVVLAGMAAMAQTVISGDLTGTLIDPQGAVIADAKVVLKNLATGTIDTAVTNKSGVYRFSLLKPGNYQLVVSQPGFKKLEVTTPVLVGQATKVDLRMTLGQAGEVVNVVEGVNLMDTENANSTTTYSPTELETIPSPGGDTTAYALTTPGVTLSTGGGYGNFSANGLPGNANLFTTNGFDNNDAWNNLNNSGATNLTLGANELQEMSVVINGYTGQYGRQAGAQVNSVTKSGGNSFHGNALYWWNGRAMNGNDWINKQTELSEGKSNTRPFSNNNQYAASIGGPIIKDKLFFFVNTEGLRVILPGGGTTYVPTVDFANDVKANVANLNPAASPFYDKIFSLYNSAHGSGSAIPLATSDGGCGSTIANTINNINTGTKINNILYGTGVNPCAKKYFSSSPNTQNEWLLMTRIDYNLSDRDRLFGRFKSDHGSQATSTDPINSAFSASSTQPSYEGQLQETHTFNNTTVNQLIIGGSWYKAIFSLPDFATAVGIFPTAMNFNDGVLQPLGGNSNSGYGLNSYPSGRALTQYMVIDDLSHIAGAHNLKFGVNFRGNKFSDYYHLANATGWLTLNMNDFANGSFDPTNGSSFSQAFSKLGPIPVTSYSVGFYAQDEWKIKPRLTVTAALRVDHNSNLHCLSNCFSRLSTDWDSMTHDATIPYNQVISSGLKTAFPGIEALVYQPRFGVVYDLGHGTVMRGGIGAFSDLFPASLMRYAVQAPNVNTFSASGSGVLIADKGTTGGFFDNTSAQNAAFQTGYPSGGTSVSIGGVTNPLALPMWVFPKMKNPKFVEWNYQIEKSIGSKGALVVNYAGNHGYDMLMDNPFTNASTSGTAMNGLSNTTPDSRFAQVVTWSNTGRSNYNGVTGTFNWRFNTLFTGGFNYTYSHGLDTCSNECIYRFNYLTAPSIVNQTSPRGTQLSYGNADYDTRHAINAHYVLTSPKFTGSNRALRTAAAGWSAAGTIYYHSGYPFSFVNSGARSDINNASGLVTANVLADYLGSKAVSCTSPTNACAGSTDFVQGAQSNFGNYSRNSFRGPGYFDTDLQIMKSFTLTEGTKLGLGANFFNLLNHPNFDLPVNDVANSSVGQIISTVSSTTSPYGTFVGALASGRIVQLHAKLTF